MVVAGIGGRAKFFEKPMNFDVRRGVGIPREANKFGGQVGEGMGSCWDKRARIGWSSVADNGGGWVKYGAGHRIQTCGGRKNLR